MKKSIFITAFLILTATIFSQTETVTYTAGDIPTTYSSSASITTSSTATDPGTLTITLPIGTTITSVDVAYQMTATNSAYMAEQRSFLKCVSTGGTTEPEVYSGVGNAEGTYSYNRTNLDIANSVTNVGNIEFELHAFRTYFDDGSNTTHQYVNNNSWSVTIHYIPPTANPTNFVQTPKDASRIELTWSENTNNDNVLIAVNSTNTFGTPTPGTAYTVGGSLTGGGSVIYNSNGESFDHNNLESQTTYFYKAWSVDGDNYYSSGVEGNATTRSNPIVSNVTFTNRDGIVDVYYDVTDGEDVTVTISMEVSDDGGLTYDFSCTQVTGDVGDNVAIGTGKHIVWNFGREHSGVVGNNFIVKIIADDLFGDQIYYAHKTYNTITIGTQTWLKENLDVGTMINSTTGGSQQTENGTIEKYCYNNDASNCDTYGGLYEWNEAMHYVTTEGTQGICPSGWHIPTYSQMQDLKSYVNNKAVKLIDQSQTMENGLTPTNETGFFALFAGVRGSNSGSFSYLSSRAVFWSSTENGMVAYDMSFRYDVSAVRFYYDDKPHGFSVRCLKD